MTSNLRRALFATYQGKADPVLAAGAWPDGRPLTDDDVDWFAALSRIMRLELLGPTGTPAAETELELRAGWGDR